MNLHRLILGALCSWIVACGVTEPASVPLNGPCLRDTDCQTPFACSEGLCQLPSARICTPEQRRCNGNQLEICGETGWSTESTCELGCVPGEEPACRPTVCPPGERRCDGSFILECLSNGSAWTSVQTCPTDCIAEAGLVECSEPVCQPFATRCKEGDPSALETCNSRGTAWESSVCQGLAASGSQAAVPGVCADSRCQLALCTPGSERCAGNVVELCNPNGTGWSAIDVCSNGCVEEGSSAFCPELVCVPGASRCADTLSVELCNERGTGWTKSTCSLPAGDSRCVAGECVPKVCSVTRTANGAIHSREERCNGNAREVCSDDESTFTALESCAFGCAETGAATVCLPPACEPGEEMCEGNSLLRCSPDQVFFSLVQYCPSGCNEDAGASPTSASCAPNACAPLNRRCTSTASGAGVELCRADGSGYELLETCPGTCSNARCEITADTCLPGELRCQGSEVEECVAQPSGGTRWQFSERCLGTCSAGACDTAGACGCAEGDDSEACGSPSRTPIVLRAMLPNTNDEATYEDDTLVPCDDTSTVLVYSEVIRASDGTPVPDGTPVTFTHDGEGSLLASADADLVAPGLQRLTLNGRAIVRVKAPAECEAPRALKVSASIGGRCSGSGTVPFAPPPEPGDAPTRLVFVADDFSSGASHDPATTQTLLSPTLGTVSAHSEFEGGDGRDGHLLLAAGSTHVLSTGFARHWDVSALGVQDARVEAHQPNLAPGDEVMLLTVWARDSSYVGSYEFKRVASAASGGRVTFTEPVRLRYAPDHENIDSSTRVVLQRVPQFQNVNVPSGSLLTTAAPVATGGRPTGGTGVIALRASGVVTLMGSLSVNERGYPAGSGAPVAPAASSTIGKLVVGTANAGGNAGAIYLHAAAVVFRAEAGEASASALISAAGQGSGDSGTVWVAAGRLDFGSVARIVAQGGARNGVVRLDYAQSTPASPLTLPAAHSIQRGSLRFQSLPAFVEPGIAPSLDVRSARLVGLIAGHGESSVLSFPVEGGLGSVVPGLSFALSADNGTTWAAAENAPIGFSYIADPRAGKRVRWRADLSATRSDDLRLRGLQLQLNLH